MHNWEKIRKGIEFDIVFRTGTRINGELVRILYLRDITIESVKFGCAVGKRQGKAHVRTRGRRILREAFRTLPEAISPGIRLVLMLSDKGLTAKTPEITRELRKLLSRKKLLCYQGQQ